VCRRKYIYEVSLLLINGDKWLGGKNFGKCCIQLKGGRGNDDAAALCTTPTMHYVHYSLAMHYVEFW
jgi:hypothetical protein